MLIPDEQVAALSDAVQSADRRTLAAVLTHLSGDPDLLAPDCPVKAMQAAAQEILPRFVDVPAVAPPSDQVLLAAMRHAAAEPVPEAYGDMVRYDMGELGPPPVQAPLQAPPGFSVAVIGAGVTGLAAGLQLRALGFTDFTIFERAESVGGIWWQNTYPGCRVDTPSMVYTLSTRRNAWPNHFSFQPDILAYLQDVSKDLAGHIQTGVEVKSLEWNAADCHWKVSGTRDGNEFSVEANVVIGATGFLNIPSVPRIPGADSFAGQSFHSSEWPADADIKGRRVAVIGAGASANQIVPATAPLAAHLTVFQRTPHWITRHPYYDREITGSEQFLLERIPTYRGWFRFRQFWSIGDQNMKYSRIDPAWTGQQASVSELNEAVRNDLIGYITDQAGDRPDLMAKVVPDYPPFAKRVIIDNGWYKALRRANVDLVTSPIVKIVPAGIVTADGLVPLDTIVYATGFQTNRVLWPIEITGRDGVNVREQQDTSPEAYLGAAVESCPNLFVTDGPNSIPVHGGTITFLAECQARYIAECLRHMFDSHWQTMEIKPAALREFVARTRAENLRYVWSIDGVSNWYKGVAGVTSLALPWTNLRVWQESRHPDFSVYQGG